MGLSPKKVTSNDVTLDCSQSPILHPDTFKCPRCESTNTKFCYYNNYSKTQPRIQVKSSFGPTLVGQPRYFCKACKRHWTEGGTLRNIPIGSGRKNRRLKMPAPKTNTTPSNRVNPQMPDHLNNNDLILRQPSSGFHLQDSYYSSGNKLVDGDHHLLHGPISSSLEANLCSFQSFAMEDSSVTAMMPSTSSCITSQAVGNKGGMEYWNWDDIDSLVSTDLNISSWDDPAEIKP